jgi:hypothetical protein
MRSVLLAVFALCACGGAGLPDGGSGNDGGGGGLDCKDLSVTACSSEGSGCQRPLLDDACWEQCTCTSGRWSCQRTCPAIEPCRQGGYCGQPLTCSTSSDAGCAIDCQCRPTIPGYYATCVKRCGGLEGQCFDAGTVDAGTFTCSAP